MTPQEIAALRAGLRKARAAVPREQRLAMSRQIEACLAGWDVFLRARTVLAYRPVRSEAGTDALAQCVLDAGKQLLLPRCLKKGWMEAVRVARLDGLCPDVYGIPAPPPNVPAARAEEIDLLLVPGVAFDERGGRLGQGGGCYDRFLPRCAGVIVGVAFSMQVVERLPLRAHDVRMDALLTERGIMCFGGRAPLGL